MTKLIVITTVSIDLYLTNICYNNYGTNDKIKYGDTSTVSSNNISNSSNSYIHNYDKNKKLYDSRITLYRHFNDNKTMMLTIIP